MQDDLKKKHHCLSFCGVKLNVSPNPHVVWGCVAQPQLLVSPLVNLLGENSAKNMFQGFDVIIISHENRIYKHRDTKFK